MSFSVPYEKIPDTAVQGEEDSKMTPLEGCKDENFSPLSDPEKGQPQPETPWKLLKPILKSLLVLYALLVLLAAILVILMRFFTSDKFMKYVAHNYRFRSFTYLAMLTSGFCFGTVHQRNPNSMAFKIISLVYLLSLSSYLAIGII
ncbi:hypothetical protein BABINDRAFT_160619 [Babjeviella inositovora NRRL Y-12698]|uniref:Uncharacterized protein n=1 Tax=Babjeviella inositovora NRRL Y-12698 TaxID=984486 RepID=A0A1E3QU95_9ASCO|nr:uncharacterized protein BABINDRAFT_160619 [Babjeviella inositovora NRRL Y-12698]ODQ81240.1 hypothetical protein BABINDRAFT_160619 [Babjeviella inositovora NRRL Y-12698]